MQINKVIKLNNINTDLISINQKEILKLLGYNVSNPDKIITDLIAKLSKSALNKIKPWGTYIISEIQNLSKDTVSIENTDFNVNKIVASYLKKANYVALFICTVGSDIEKESTNLMEKNEMLEGYIMNLIGSVTAEALADLVHEEIKINTYKDNLSTTNRYSPGYCNWDVKEQFKLFSFFPDQFNKIKLTESALMNPVKSVSGIIGIGKDVIMRPYSCDKCNDLNCIYRSIRN